MQHFEARAVRFAGNTRNLWPLALMVSLLLAIPFCIAGKTAVDRSGTTSTSRERSPSWSTRSSTVFKSPRLW